MAAWDNVEGFEFQHDLITPSLDRQAACLSLNKILKFLAALRINERFRETDGKVVGEKWQNKLTYK